MTGNQSSSRKLYWILLCIFFSFLPIATAILGVCAVLGVLLMGLTIPGNHYLLAGVAFLVLTLTLGWFLPPLAYRFLARAFPLKASGALNRASLRALRFALAVMLAACVGLGFLGWGCIPYIVAPPDGGIYPRAAVAVMWTIQLMPFAILLLFCLCLTHGVFRMIALHRRPTAWTSQQFVLFLRSFGSVSDSAALGPLVRASGILMRVALLSSPRQLKASWNPFTLAIPGFSFGHPFRSVPVFLESTDSSWADDVRHLAASARLVVIDITHRSPGLVHEIDILAESGLYEKTLRFEELPRGGVSDANSRAPAEGVVFVERSQVLRRLSQSFGFISTYFGFVVLSASLVNVFDLYCTSRPAQLVLRSSVFYSVVPAVWGAWKLSPAAGFTRRSAKGFIEAMKLALRRHWRP